MHISHEPVFRIWVEGRPMSWRKSRKSLSRYVERIAEAARNVVPFPVRSPRIDIEIWYRAPHVSRADVDNIVKPVLDALIGVVYHDDRQVRSIRAVALPTDDIYGISGWGQLDVFRRLIKGEEPQEFLINIFEGMFMPGGGP